MRGRLRFRALVDVVPVFWLAHWATWPSKQERERQREVSKLYDYHFEERRRRSYGNAESTPILGPPGGSSTFLNRRQRTYYQPVA